MLDTTWAPEDASLRWLTSAAAGGYTLSEPSPAYQLALEHSHRLAAVEALSRRREAAIA